MRNIVMVGTGGTGSHLLHPLLQYLGSDYLVHLYDADIVEEKNLNRQLFYPFEVNTHKAMALAERFGNLVEPHLEYVGEENIETAIREGDTVLICADNMAVRRLINTHAKSLKNVTIINGGNEKDTGSVQVFIRRNNKNITPPLDFFSPEFERLDDPNRADLSCAEVAQLPGGEQTVVANNSVAALMLQALARADKDIYKKKQQWTKTTFDIPAGTFQTSDVRLIGGYDAQ